MQPIVSVIGKSNSGKTTLLEGLIAEFKRRGYRVAAVKHSRQEVELDTAGKDTWRFSRAGSELTAISTSGILGVFRRTDHDPGLPELSRAIGGGYDLILTEGFKKQEVSLKIEVHRREQGSDLVGKPEQLLAVVTDEPLGVAVPQFSRDDINGIADLIEQTTLKKRNADDLDLFVNGAYLPTGTAFNAMLTRTLLAMIADTGYNTAVRDLSINMRRKN